jgi:hypothetical protein
MLHSEAIAVVYRFKSYSAFPFRRALGQFCASVAQQKVAVHLGTIQEYRTMTPKKLIVALALLLSATSATFAMGGYRSDGSYATSGYDPGAITQR